MRKHSAKPIFIYESREGSVLHSSSSRMSGMTQVGESYDGAWKRFLKSRIAINNSKQVISGYGFVWAVAASPFVVGFFYLQDLLHGSSW